MVHQWSNHNPLIMTIFMTIDGRFVILWDFEFFEKGPGSSNCRKIRAIVLNLHTNILHPSRNFGIEFGQNRLKRSNFFRFWIFWEFIRNCRAKILCVNALILSDVWYWSLWKSVETFQFQTNLNFFLFFTVTSNFKNSMYSRSFLCEEAKIK